MVSTVSVDLVGSTSFFVEKTCFLCNVDPLDRIGTADPLFTGSVLEIISSFVPTAENVPSASFVSIKDIAELGIILCSTVDSLLIDKEYMKNFY